MTTTLSREIIRDIIKKHYDCLNAADSIKNLFEKTGLSALIDVFIEEIMTAHILMYSKTFPEMSAENLEHFLTKELKEIISSNISTGSEDFVTNEIENYVSWAELDVDNFMAGIENYIDSGQTPQTYPTVSVPTNKLPDADDLDDVWKSGEEAWSCDYVKPEKEKPTSVNWGEDW